MRLYELAYCSNAFVHLDGFDQATVGLRDTTGPFVDPGNPAHHGPLFRWLRRWGCRQFKIADETIASASLAAWWQTFDEQLPDPGATPDQLSDDILDGIAAAFDDLSKRQASWQDRRDVGQIFRGFGPAGAAKTLYAVRPNSCSPWDDPIRRAEDLSATGDGYRSHLAKTREALAEAVADLGPGGFGSTPPCVAQPPALQPGQACRRSTTGLGTRAGSSLRPRRYWRSGQPGRSCPSDYQAVYSMSIGPTRRTLSRP